MNGFAKSISLAVLFFGLIFTAFPSTASAEEECETVEGVVATDTGTSTRLIWRMSFIGCFYDEIAKRCSPQGGALMVKNDGSKDFKWFSSGLTPVNGYTLKAKTVEYFPLSYYRRKGDKIVIQVSVTKCKDTGSSAQTRPPLSVNTSPLPGSTTQNTPSPTTAKEPVCHTYKGKVSWTGTGGDAYIKTPFWGSIIDANTGIESSKGGVLRVKNTSTKETIKWYSPGLTAVNGYTLKPGETDDIILSIYRSKNDPTWIQIEVEVTVCK